MRRIQTPVIAAALVAAGALPHAADAATSKFRADVGELNGSGVSGVVNFALDTTTRDLRITGRISGLVPNQVHIQHVHGCFENTGPCAEASDMNDGPRVAKDSVPPPPSADTDGDGIISVAEGAPFYGDILLPIEDQSDGFNNDPFVGDDGILTLDYRFNLDDDGSFLNPLSGMAYTGDDILPLTDREYVIHGLFVDGAYDISTPVGAASIEVAPVPLPAGAVLLLSGLAGLGVARRRRKPA